MANISGCNVFIIAKKYGIFQRCMPILPAATIFIIVVDMEFRRQDQEPLISAPPYNPLPEEMKNYSAPSPSYSVNLGEKTPSTFTPSSNVFYSNGEIGSNCSVLRGLVAANNIGYRLGYHSIFCVFLLITALLSPFMGAAVAIIDWTFMMVRVILRPVGKMVADVLGYGTLVDLASQKMMKDLDV